MILSIFFSIANDHVSIFIKDYPPLFYFIYLNLEFRIDKQHHMPLDY